MLITPLDPTANVIRLALYPPCRAHSRMPSYLIVFLSLAHSNDVSKGMVNSSTTSFCAPSSHHTMSGCRLVATIC